MRKFVWASSTTEKRTMKKNWQQTTNITLGGTGTGTGMGTGTGCLRGA